ncbi:carbamoyltransferase C-terminal domain-containing protein [Streptomyces sp. NBC_01264]|uniref:carbamoyltransferase C-terminal domain-containing protein n=1 Tax=Streptomyces sp. NBC_01264 TaxID=2903804 RepID=UPI0022581F49|nr:carbamoyltransferase C-terminal domain-containing protein [Streptomyces sp. NBC_01264]MCX4776757.1 carbamoyltransferase [Streptomyces sp. NBC_01264]
MPVALGLNFHHDTSAALIVDGRLYAAEEERWSGLKHHREHGQHKAVLTAPARSLAWCLEAAGIELGQVDAVWAAGMRPHPPGGHCLATEREELAALLPQPLGDRLRLMSHHTAHMLSGYLISGLGHAAGLVIDAGGSPLGVDFGPGRERTTGYDLRPGLIDRVHQSIPSLSAGPVGVERGHHSLGHFYRNMAHRVIPPGDEPEGSMMALAAYGDPARYRQLISELIHLGGDGVVRIAAPYGSADSCTPLKAGSRAWTQAGAAEVPLAERADFAAAVQEAFAAAVVHTARHLRRLTRATDLVFSGGCALNSHLNGTLAQDSGFDRLFIAPAPHDAGTAVGAALYGWHHHLGNDPLPAPVDAGWGPVPGALSLRDVPDGWHNLGDLGDDLGPTVAGLLAGGSIIGWVQGPMEFGPRALGHRSILAHPGHAGSRDRLNTIKRRAAYRPFAPAVLDTHLRDWFTGDADPFMNRVARIRPEQAAHVPDVVHHDGTARVQTVAAGHTGLGRLLEEFRQQTGLPMLLNTSFNLKGTPILRTAAQAAQGAAGLGLDALAVGTTLLAADHGQHAAPARGWAA